MLINDPIPLKLTISWTPTTPVAGQQVTLHVTVDKLDGDVTHAEFEFGANQVGYAEDTYCIVPFLPEHRDWKFVHTYMQPGSYTLRVRIVTDQCAPILVEDRTVKNTITVT